MIIFYLVVEDVCPQIKTKTELQLSAFSPNQTQGIRHRPRLLKALSTFESE